jgi:energy-coupling factor transporter transmembrane protein EcfT
MISHVQIIQLIVAYTLVGAFVFTVVITCFSLVGWIKFANKKQQQKLFAALIIQLVIGCVGFFTQLLQFNPQSVANELVEQGKTIRQIQDSIQERHFTENQRTNLTDILSRIAKCPIEIYAVDGDREAIRFSMEIYQLFKDAGWPVNGPHQDMLIGGSPSGLCVIQRPWDATNGIYIKYIFGLHKYDVQLAEFRSIPTNTINFWVGVRP